MAILSKLVTLERRISMFNKSYDEVINIIRTTLDSNHFTAAFLFGSYGTEDFNDLSDIDIAVLTDLGYCEIKEYQDRLEQELDIEVDLVNAEELPMIFQLQITNRSCILFCKDEEILNDFYDRTEFYYKTDYRIWKAWQEEEW